jgi:hypothetical protein
VAVAASPDIAGISTEPGDKSVDKLSFAIAEISETPAFEDLPIIEAIFYIVEFT